MLTLRKSQSQGILKIDVCEKPCKIFDNKQESPEERQHNFLKWLASLVLISLSVAVTLVGPRVNLQVNIPVISRALGWEFKPKNLPWEGGGVGEHITKAKLGWSYIFSTLTDTKSL